MSKLPARVALVGFSNTGKSEAAKCLENMRYTSHSFGTIIKKQVDPLVYEYFGFSAFTEDRRQKERIRRTLEAWGEDRYDAILREYMATLPEKAVNTRLVRCREADAWKSRGGVIVEIKRPGYVAATQWEHDRFRELEDAGFIDATVVNNGPIAGLHAALIQTLSELSS